MEGVRGIPTAVRAVDAGASPEDDATAMTAADLLEIGEAVPEAGRPLEFLHEDLLTADPTGQEGPRPLPLSECPGDILNCSIEHGHWRRYGASVRRSLKFLSCRVEHVSQPTATPLPAEASPTLRRIESSSADVIARPRCGTPQSHGRQGVVLISLSRFELRLPTESRTEVVLSVGTTSGRCSTSGNQERRRRMPLRTPPAALRSLCTAPSHRAREQDGCHPLVATRIRSAHELCSEGRCSSPSSAAARSCSAGAHCSRRTTKGEHLIDSCE